MRTRTSLDDGLLRADAARTGCVVLSRAAAGRALGGRRGLGAHGQRSRAARARWASPTCSSTWCSRAPSGAARARSRSSSRSRGGSLDAYTSRDHTSFQAHVLDEDLRSRPDVLTDLVRRPLLREGDLELERNVVLEEITTRRGHARRSGVRAARAPRSGAEHPYGYSILGTRETVGALTCGRPARAARPRLPPRATAWSRRRATWSTSQLLELLRAGRAGSTASGAHRSRRPVAAAAGAARRSECRVERDTAQTTSCSAPTPSRYRDPRRFALVDPDQRRSAAGCRAGCSSGCARSSGWPTRSTPTSSSIQIGGHGWASTSAPSRRPPTRPRRRSWRSTARLAREGLAAGRAGRRQAAAQGADHAVAGEPAARMYRLAGVALHGEPYRPLDADPGGDRRGDGGRRGGGGGGVLRSGAADGGEAGAWLGSSGQVAGCSDSSLARFCPLHLQPTPDT